MFKIKRVYDKPEKSDGFRILVDRLWSRGLSKEKARIDDWLKDIAPSDKLRKWFHKEKNWNEFKRCYFAELKDKKDLLKKIKDTIKSNNVTLEYAAKDEERNNAKALLEFIKSGKI